MEKFRTEHLIMKKRPNITQICNLYLINLTFFLRQIINAKEKKV